MRHALILLAVAVFLVFPGHAYSCQFDTDCSVGSVCLKSSGSLYGVCVGGLSPGNKNDKTPVYSPTDINGTYGNTCSFDVDCGIGSVCIKSSGSITGVCMKQQ